MKSLPPSVEAYRRTPEFDESSVPKALRASHSTKAGVWGRIVVLEGALHYRIPASAEDVLLEPGREGVVEPQVEHAVEPAGPVRFFVEFLREPSA